MRGTSNRKLSKHSWKPQDTVIVFGNEETKKLFRKIFFFILSLDKISIFLSPFSPFIFPFY